jgi:hypothetical protein
VAVRVGVLVFAPGGVFVRVGVRVGVLVAVAPPGVFVLVGVRVGVLVAVAPPGVAVLVGVRVTVGDGGCARVTDRVKGQDGD